MPGTPVVTVDLVRRTVVRFRVSGPFVPDEPGGTHIATQYRVRRVASPYVVVYDAEDWPLYTTDDVAAEGNFVVSGGDLTIVPGAAATLTNLLVADETRIYGVA